MTFKVARNYKEYLAICKSIYSEDDRDAVFNDLQEWEAFFDARLKCNEDEGEYLETIEQFKGPLKYKPDPDEYPVLVAYVFDKDPSYRFGTLTIQLWQWHSIKDLGLEVSK